MGAMVRTTTITVTEVTITCRCYAARTGGSCEHEVPRGASSRSDCPPECECHECWQALQYAREGRIWGEFRAQTRPEILPPPPESAVKLPPFPAPYVGSDIAETGVEAVRPLARRVA